jgi:uncharacterized membrane protein
MVYLLAVCLFAVCLWMRGRLTEVEVRLAALERWDRGPVAPPVPPAPAARPAPASPPKAIVYQPIAPRPVVAAAPGPAPQRDWESLVGGNWLNKVGVLILVIGIALALGYSFTRVGPGGRVAISLAGSFAMLGAGVALQERYRVFANGLAAGGWAALYFTTYAMHAVAAARVIDNPYGAAALLLAVSAGMIGHSLRYRSEAVTSLAYGIAFATLAIAEPNGFAIPALLPLAVSLLFVARRFGWRRMALLGVVGTYGVIALRGDAGSPLWQTQTLVAAFWLLFEAFDLAVGVLLPLNAAGFLGLSVLAWQARAPEEVWKFAAGAAAAYLVSAVLRRRSPWWPAAATIAAALAAAAVFLRGEGQWTTFALLIEAEGVYLAGVRLRAPYLRHLAGGVFAAALAQLAAAGGNWVPAAAIGAALFYANSFVDRFHGYAGAALLALIVGHEAPQHRGHAWTGLAAILFTAGWGARRLDVRLQGYGIGLLGLAWRMGAPGPLALSWSYGHLAAQAAPWATVGAFYAGALCGRFSTRIAGREADILRLAASVAASLPGALAVWRAVPVAWTGVAWLALGAVIVELGVRDLPRELRRIGIGIAGMGAVLAFFHNVLALANHGAWGPRFAPLLAAGACAFVALRATEARSVARVVAAGFLAAAAWSLLPPAAVAPVWAAMALAGRSRKESYVLAAAAVWRSCDPQSPILGAAAVVVILHCMRRTWASLAGSGLLAVLLYHHVSGSLLTIAWGAEGVALLAAGFALRDRVPRLSGLYALLFCIGKAFVYDLRHLETLPRIFSFLVLGVILVGVSWLYARYRAASRSPTTRGPSER